ncbi:hypothetical protein SAMN05519104_5381 [Rhizobiales bacterium GAS188]|nr:hypothetical protein SAMN05519104_5381 [Rhizobiales bacterium GAS188]
MTIKTVLVGTSGGSSSNGAIELACRIALRFGAHATRRGTNICLEAPRMTLPK